MHNSPAITATIAASKTSSRRSLFVAVFSLLGLSLFLLAGCAGTPHVPPAELVKTPDPLSIAEGDVLKIVFPGASNLDSQQQVRRDGRITMGLIGEVVAVGMTPKQLEERLLKLYDKQLQSMEVSVTVVSSNFTVFVTGAVIRPGKVIVDHQLTALEALMEAGGFDPSRADTKGVVVIRQVEGRTVNYTVNLKIVLEGKSNEPFYLKQFDILYVPEKFSWF